MQQLLELIDADRPTAILVHVPEHLAQVPVRHLIHTQPTGLAHSLPKLLKLQLARPVVIVLSEQQVQIDTLACVCGGLELLAQMHKLLFPHRSDELIRRDAPVAIPVEVKHQRIDVPRIEVEVQTLGRCRQLGRVELARHVLVHLVERFLRFAFRRKSAAQPLHRLQKERTRLARGRCCTAACRCTRGTRRRG